MLHMLSQIQSGSTISSFLNVLHTSEDPPTYFRTNRYTSGFHALIQAYGVASYREVNPSQSQLTLLEQQLTICLTDPKY